MKNLSSYLFESFFDNVGVNDYLTNAITEGQDKIIKYGINPRGKILKTVAAEITKNTPTSIHVKIKGIKLSKQEFDIDFSEYENAIKEFAGGKFSNLIFKWNVDTSEFADRGKFVMRFFNTNTRRDYYLSYYISDDILKKW